MQYEEYRQLRKWSWYEGIYLSILWIASFACMVLIPVSPLLGNISTLLAFATPFLVAYSLKKYRNTALDGVISYRRALLFCFRVFFNASLLFALAQWLYLQYVDGGRLRTIFESVVNTNEWQEIMKAYGINASELSAALQQAFDPLYFASVCLIQDLIIGLVLSIFIAAIYQKKLKTT